MVPMLDTYLVERTKVTAKGDGVVVNVSGASSPVMLLSLQITSVVEQESIDVSVFGAPDESTWGMKPLAVFPQLFYPGDYPMLLDLRGRNEIKLRRAHWAFDTSELWIQGGGQIKFLRAHWEVNRWGRGPDTPMFELSLRLREVSPDLLDR